MGPSLQNSNFQSAPATFAPILFGLHRFGLVCTGLVWFAPVWFAPVWFEPVWFAPVWSVCLLPYHPARPASVLRDFLYARRPVGRLSNSSLKCTPQRLSLLRRPPANKTGACEARESGLRRRFFNIRTSHQQRFLKGRVRATSYKELSMEKEREERVRGDAFPCW